MSKRPDPRDEMDAIARARAMIGTPIPGEVWSGDDAAVLWPAQGKDLIATDVVVENVHFDRRYSSLSDVGWKSVAVNVSDIAAMGGEVRSIVVTVVGAATEELDELWVGLIEASRWYQCPIVGGDVSSGALLSVGVTILGQCTNHTPVLRSGAHPGDLVFVTGPLGNAAAGLRALHADPLALGEHVQAHRRPRARLAEGQLAAELGATAMIDVSDGFGLDLSRLLDASAVGVELSEVPVAAMAEERDALGGGEDYELIFTMPDEPRSDRVKSGVAEPDQLAECFEKAGLRVPIAVGVIKSDQSVRRLKGSVLKARGYAHDLGSKK